jgi:hypothetical protein
MKKFVLHAVKSLMYFKTTFAVGTVKTAIINVKNHK